MSDILCVPNDNPDDDYFDVDVSPRGEGLAFDWVKKGCGFGWLTIGFDGDKLILDDECMGIDFSMEVIRRGLQKYFDQNRIIDKHRDSIRDINCSKREKKNDSYFPSVFEFLSNHRHIKSHDYLCDFFNKLNEIIEVNYDSRFIKPLFPNCEISFHSEGLSLSNYVCIIFGDPQTFAIKMIIDDDDNNHIRIIITKIENNINTTKDYYADAHDFDSAFEFMLICFFNHFLDRETEYSFEYQASYFLDNGEWADPKCNITDCPLCANRPDKFLIKTHAHE